MKKLLRLAAAASLVLMLASCTASNPVIKDTYSGVLPEIRAPKSIDYSGETYRVGYSAITRTGVIVEYFKQGQGPNSWTKLISLRTTNPPSTPEKEAVALLRLVKSSGGAGALLKNERKNETIADFMLPKSGDLEFNLFRYVPQSGNGGTKSVQYAEIIPKSKIGKTDLIALRSSNLKQIAALKLPAVDASN